MPSSTSSSEPADARRVALRAAVATASVLAAGLLLARCNTYALDWALLETVRLREAVAALPELAAAPDPKAMVFGSSLVFAGFDVEVFDARLGERGVELHTYNLGIGGLNPDIQRPLARRVRAAFEDEGRRLALTLVEFNPFQATGARARSNLRSREQKLAMLATPGDLARQALTDPHRAARSFAVRYLRGGISAEAMTEIYGALAEIGLSALPVENPSPPRFPPEQAEAIRARGAARNRVMMAMFDVHGGKPAFWELERRGQFRLMAPQIRDDIATMMRPSPWELEQDLARRIRCCDIVDLDFDDALVDDFIALVGDLAAVSERIEIVLFPKNADWVKSPPEARERQRATLERIERETGVAIADFQEQPRFDGSKFSDVTHLTMHEASREFSTFLADRYAPQLAPADR